MFAPRDNRGLYMLPQSAEEGGYYVYGTPGNGAGQYAHPLLMSVIFQVERQWMGGEQRKFGIGNISLAGGGQFKPHHSHRDGRQADVRALRIDGRHDPVEYTNKQYDFAATKKLIELFLAHPAVTRIYFNDSRIKGAISRSQHNNHFHVEVAK